MLKKEIVSCVLLSYERDFILANPTFFSVVIHHMFDPQSDMVTMLTKKKHRHKVPWTHISKYQSMPKSINTIFNLDKVDIIGNRGTSSSPSEFFAGRDFQNFINELSENYDYIFMEGASLNKYSDTRELTEFSDAVISIFSAQSEIKEVDKDSINYLMSLDDKFMGSVLNKFELKNLN